MRKKEINKILDAEEKKDRKERAICSRYTQMFTDINKLHPELQYLVLETVKQYPGPGMVENLSRLAGLKKDDLDFEIVKLETWKEKVLENLFEPYRSKNGWCIPAKLMFLYGIRQAREELKEKEKKGVQKQ